MSAPFRIAIAGLGTVGGGTLELLARNAELIAERCGKKVELVGVSAHKHRNIGIPFVADAMQLLALKPDALVEVIGGSEGIARSLVEAALTQSISVVTANKALIAHHGLALAKLAEASGATLAFEAAVAGGIPIIKSLRDGLAANRFTRIAGILNGTCNYILTRMEQEQKPFDEILKEAQTLGYAEAEPSFDVDGIDTAHKTAILGSLAFGFAPAIDRVHVEGIRRVTLRDMAFAKELGFRIKLLGIAEQSEHGVFQRVHPTLIPITSPIANVHDVYNAVVADGDAVGKVFFEGRGAGAGPTASSIVADIMDIARGTVYKPFTLAASRLKSPAFAAMTDLKSAYYARISVTDRAGVLADVTGIFRDEGISVHSFLQHSHQPEGDVNVVLTTHETTEQAMMRAADRIARLPAVSEQPYLIRIEPL